MKKLIAIAILAVASVIGVNAQSTQSQNQFVAAYNFATSDISVERANHTRFNSDTDSHGFTLGYTRFTKGDVANGKVGVLGLTGEVTANFDKDEANQVTVMAGPTLQARNNSYVQPYARVLAGVARQHINRANIADNADASFAIDGGAGLDFAFAKGSRYGF